MMNASRNTILGILLVIFGLSACCAAQSSRKVTLNILYVGSNIPADQVRHSNSKIAQLRKRAVTEISSVAVTGGKLRLDALEQEGESSGEPLVEVAIPEKSKSVFVVLTDDGEKVKGTLLDQKVLMSGAAVFVNEAKQDVTVEIDELDPISAERGKVSLFDPKSGESTNVSIQMKYLKEDGTERILCSTQWALSLGQTEIVILTSDPTSGRVKYTNFVYSLDGEEN